MAYPALAIGLLISAPSDIPDDDLATIKRTISQWNHAVGRASGKVILPMSWSEHAVAEFGDRPQAVLNEQLVDLADMAIALFADRLGTPTGKADSGTLEEIDELVAAGKHVSVLLNVAPRAPLSGERAVAEKGRLEAALVDLKQRAIVLQYADQAALAGHVNNMLSMAAGKVEGGAAQQAQSVDSEAIGVWPHAVTTESVEASGSGVRTRKNHAIEIRNETGRPVFDVSIATPPGTYLGIVEVGDVIASMAPGGTAQYFVALTMDSGRKADVTVTWRYADGEPQTSTATVAF